jgi:hypothetical protein
LFQKHYIVISNNGNHQYHSKKLRLQKCCDIFCWSVESCVPKCYLGKKRTANFSKKINKNCFFSYFNTFLSTSFSESRNLLFVSTLYTQNRVNVSVVGHQFEKENIIDLNIVCILSLMSKMNTSSFYFDFAN